MAESIQHKLGRVRPPRVQITYDVEIGDAIEKKELPFVIGVLADLTNTQSEDAPLPELKTRKFVEIDRDNFDKVLESAMPRLEMTVPNALDDEATGDVPVVLDFKKIDDFDPDAIVKRYKPLNELYEARQRLSDLATKLDGNAALSGLLAEVVKNEEKRKELEGLITEEEPKSDGD
ncbi:MAG: type VI secretion system contractile sheath small subunit [Pseudomonadota bacterium]